MKQVEVGEKWNKGLQRSLQVLGQASTEKTVGKKEREREKKSKTECRLQTEKKYTDSIYKKKYIITAAGWQTIGFITPDCRRLQDRKSSEPAAGLWPLGPSGSSSLPLSAHIVSLSISAVLLPSYYHVIPMLHLFVTDFVRKQLASYVVNERRRRRRRRRGLQ